MFSSLPGFIATLLVRFTLANKNILTPGWAARVLIQCGVRFAEIWDVFHEMYESQVIVQFHLISCMTQQSIRYLLLMIREMFKQCHPRLLSL